MATGRAAPAGFATGLKRAWPVLALVALVALAVGAWAWQAGASWPELDAFLDAARRFRRWPAAPLLALACFAIGGLIVFPVNLLIAASIVAFGPLVGGMIALVGSLLGAFVVHEVGRRMPSGTTRRWFGERGERVRERIVGNGLGAIALVRIVPVAPYSVVGFLAGVARVGRFDYLAGTALGMAPGVALHALFIDRAIAVLSDPHPLAWALLAGALALLVALALATRAWRRREAGHR